MTMWFFVIGSSYVLVWVMTGAMPALNGSILVLMGISSLTFLAASAFREEEVRLLKKEVGSVSNLEETSSLATRYSERLETRSFPKFTRFFYELVADDEGVQLHRFQMLCWTAIFVVIYCASVLQTLNLPDLGGTALGLMGISSGTYLGFKFPKAKG